MFIGHVRSLSVTTSTSHLKGTKEHKDIPGQGHSDFLAAVAAKISEWLEGG